MSATPPAPAELTANGHALDTGPDRFGEFEPANDLLGDGPALREAMAERGHLFFRELIDPDIVQQARLEVLSKYAVLGEVDDRFPLDVAIAGDRGGPAARCRCR